LFDEGDQVRLEIVDDGVGVVEAAEQERPSSLGLTIVRTLVESDLKGSLVMERANPGTRVIVRFRKEVRSGD
jgi:two-component system, sensor histidine kinase PdtaS